MDAIFNTTMLKLLTYIFVLVGAGKQCVAQEVTCYGTCPKRNQFCQPFYYRTGGLCEPCWKCCGLLKEGLGFDPTCVDKCDCFEPGWLCNDARECGVEGMFCDEGFCKSCIECSSSKCQSSCNGFMADIHIQERILRSHAYYQHMLLNATHAYGLVERDACPQLGRQSPSVTRNGCPCAMWKNAVVLKCDVGHYCAPRSPALSAQDIVLAGNTATTLNSVCVPCPLGRVCDTIGITMSAPLCPRGFYCPSPHIKIACDNGTFCPEGTTSPKSCEYSRLLMTDLYIESPKRTVIERLLYDQDPYKGNYCPANASTFMPNMACPAGYYCPGPGQKVVCPKGFFCRKQSMAPVRCGIMSRCVENGRANPEFSYVVIIFYALMILLFACDKACEKLRVRTLRKEEKRTLELLRLMPPSNPINIAKCGELVDPVRSIRFADLSAKSSADVAAHPWLWPNSGSLLPQKLNAVMGSSGCGKSTLIEMLRGRVTNGNLTGSVHIVDGAGCEHSFCMEELTTPTPAVRKIRHLMGFVPQDDVLLGELTVRENLEYSARLKLPQFRGKESTVQYIVNCVCRALGFDIKLQGRIVGTVEQRGISGGQRKRVNIGMELVGLHPIIVMDEPTSGLDASGSQGLLEFCKYLTHVGCTVIAVVHQPRCSSFLLFDQVLLLSRYGTTFCGSPFGAVAYYERALLANINVDDNPADAIMDLLTYGVRIKTGAEQGLLSQRDQANLWAAKGTLWIAKLRCEYPCFDEMMASTIEYDKDVDDAFVQRDNNRDLTFDAADLIKFFECFGFTNITISEAKQFIAVHNITNVKGLRNAFRFICGTHYLKGTYDNSILKLSLLHKLPQACVHIVASDEDGGNAFQRMRVMAKALEFGRRLMKRAGIRSIVDRSFEGLEREVLLTCLVIKGNALKIKQVTNSKMIKDKRVYKAYYGCTSTDMLGMHRQMAILIRRKLLSMARMAWFIQLLIPSIAALIVGLIHGADWGPSAFPGNIVMAMACVGVLSMVTHVRTFSLDKLFIRREVHNNVSLFAYFMAYNIVDLLWIGLIPLTFFIPYYYLTFPLAALHHFYVVGMLVCWWSSGLAYILSASPLALHWTNLIGVFIAVIFGAFIHGMNPSIKDARGTAFEPLLGLSYNRWAMEALTLQELGTRQDTMPNAVFAIMQKIGLCDADSYTFESLKDINMLLTILRYFGNGAKNIVDICNGHIAIANVVLFCQGVAWRLVAFVMMWCNYDTMMKRRLSLH